MLAVFEAKSLNAIEVADDISRAAKQIQALQAARGLGIFGIVKASDVSGDRQGRSPILSGAPVMGKPYIAGISVKKSTRIP